MIIIQSTKYTNTANLEFSGISKRCETPKKYIFPASFKSTTIVIRISWQFKVCQYRFDSPKRNN